MITFEQDIVSDNGDVNFTITIENDGLRIDDLDGRWVRLTFDQYRVITELVRKYEAMQEVANAQR